MKKPQPLTTISVTNIPLAGHLVCYSFEDEEQAREFRLWVEKYGWDIFLGGYDDCPEYDDDGWGDDEDGDAWEDLNVEAPVEPKRFWGGEGDA